MCTWLGCLKSCVKVLCGAVLSEFLLSVSLICWVSSEMGDECCLRCTDSQIKKYMFLEKKILMFKVVIKSRNSLVVVTLLMDSHFNLLC